MATSIEKYSLFGNPQTQSGALDARLMNANADSATDWQTVLAEGIAGAAQRAIGAAVGEKINDGQITGNPTQQGQPSQDNNLLILVVVLGLFLL